jgi:hypothetical protein
MNVTGDRWANELMATEDQVEKEMREEFRRRLEGRRQERLEAQERGLSEVRRLKKKDRSGCNGKAPSAQSRSEH